VKPVLVFSACALAVAGCGKLQNFGGAESPLVTFNLMFSGDLAPLRPPGDTQEVSLQATLIWGAQWLTEPFCILPAESTATAAIILAGCRDTFGFVPNRVGPSVPITIGQPTSLSLLELPTADLLVGAVTGRVAYASVIVYDDRNGNGTLDFSQPHPSAIGREGRRGDGEQMGEVADSPDVIYGASFFTMTKADQRVAYLEGAFDPTSAFYPRSGCAPPPDGFSILGAGGFKADALKTAASNQLPPEDPTTCSEKAPRDALVSIAAAAPADLVEVGCDERTFDSSTRYHEPPANQPDFVIPPDFGGRTMTCANLPSFDTGGTKSSLVQLVVSGRATDACKGLTHYTLRGCRESVSCAVPDWDLTANPPNWWPCH
jgi:hypothetical protein